MGEREITGARENAVRRAVFLDRDGVLNRAVVREGKPYPPATLDEFELMPGVVEGCRRLKEAGFLLVVATNQPDVGRGTQQREVVEAMHQELLRQLPLDGIEVCYDGGDEPSEFLKPAPGMLRRAATERGIDLPQSYMIGDRWRDVDCGRRAGCTTIFIDFGYREELREQPDFTVGNFGQAVSLIMRDFSSKT